MLGYGSGAPGMDARSRSGGGKRIYRQVTRGLVVSVAAFALALTPVAAAQVQPYQANDYKGFRSILPPGTNGSFNAAEFAQFQLAGTYPIHTRDQQPMYENLVYATPGLTAAQVPNYFKDASFGVQAGQVERTYSPRAGVTIQRDSGFGMPHIYGLTRSDTIFGAGY